MVSTQFSDKTVLFVDDDPRWLRVLENWFSDAPYSCLFCESAFDAIEALAKTHIDVIVSDISMPVMSGSDLMKEARMKAPHAQRIVMSGKLDLSATIDAINRGQVFRYIVKPCENKQIKLSIYEALQIAEKNQQQQKRQAQIRDKNAHRIRSMARSLRELEKILASAHDGVVSVVQKLASHSGDEMEQAEHVIQRVKKFLHLLDVKTEYRRQFELAVLFSQIAFDRTGMLRINPEQRLELHPCARLDEDMFHRALDVFEELDFELGITMFERLEQEQRLDLSMPLDDAPLEEIAFAVFRLAWDLSTLIDEHQHSEQEAIELIEANAELYGKDLIALLFEEERGIQQPTFNRMASTGS